MTTLAVDGRDCVAADRAGFQRHLRTYRRTRNDSNEDHCGQNWSRRRKKRSIMEREAASTHREVDTRRGREDKPMPPYRGGTGS